MNCAELQGVLPEIIDGGRSVEQEAHLSSCSACSGLVSDLHLIAQEARTLQASEEPSPRVWNSIEHTLRQWEREMTSIAEQARTLQASDEPSPRVWNSIAIALRQEGLIRQPQREPVLAPTLLQRWSRAWMLPVAAVLLVVAGIRLYKPASVSAPAARQAAVTGPPEANDDKQFLDAIASTSPTMRAQYEVNLQHVNAYIQDAKASVEADPNDEEAQQSLMDAYDQRAMVYEMAMDRSLP
jgi:hypothetical protein